MRARGSVRERIAEICLGEKDIEKATETERIRESERKKANSYSRRMT